jgi:hypothetical protein
MTQVKLVRAGDDGTVGGANGTLINPAAVTIAAGSLAQLAILSAVTSSGAAVVSSQNRVDATSGNLSLSLPTGQPRGTLINVEKTDASANTVSVTGSIRGVGSSTLVLRLQNESVLVETDASGSWWPIADHKPVSSLDGRYVNLNSADTAIPGHVVISDRRIDINRAPYNATPGTDITTTLQTAINDLLGVTTGQAGIQATSTASGEIYFSVPGTYNINGAAVSSSNAGGSWNAQILFPGFLGLGIGGHITIRGIGHHVWSGAQNQPGVKLVSNVANADIFSVVASGTGTYPALSHLHLQFRNITLVNSVVTGGGIDAVNCGSLQMRQYLVYNSAGGSPTRTGIVYPHGIQNGDMISENGGLGGYATGIQLAEHVVFAGWHGFTSCTNALTFTGAGHVANFGQIWVSNCATVLNAGGGGATTHICGIVDWEQGGLSGGRIVNDPSGQLVGKVIVNHSNMLLAGSTSSLPATVGNSAGTNNGCALDIAVMNGGPSWQDAHPVDTFIRELPGLSNADNPGYTSHTWHPWRVQSGLIAQDTVNGNISNANALTAASCYLPVKRGRYGGESRAISVTLTTGSTYTGLQMQAQRNLGGTSNGKNIAINLNGANVLLQVSGPGTVYTATPTGGAALAANSTYTAVLVILVGADGLPTRARVYWSAVRTDAAVSTNGTTTVTDAAAVATDVGRTVTGPLVPYGTVVQTVSAGVSFTVNNTIATQSGVAFTLTSPSVEVCDHQLTATERSAFAPGTKWPFLEDGMQWSSTDVGSKFLNFTVRSITEDDVVGRSGVVAFTEAAGVGYTPDASLGVWHTVTVSDNTAFQVSTPLNPPDVTIGQELTIEILNSSGGALTAGNVTFQTTGTASFKTGGNTLILPANGKKRFVTFKWNGVNWVWTAPLPAATAGVDY